MNLARVAALIAFIAAILLAFGWLVETNVAKALGCIAIGLALELLAGVPIVAVER